MNFTEFDTHGWFNLFEASYWFAFAAGFALFPRFRPVASETLRLRLKVVSGTFVVFGISDLIEISTGAWWRPWWLFLIKGTCILVFLSAVVQYVRERRSK